MSSYQEVPKRPVSIDFQLDSVNIFNSPQAKISEIYRNNFQLSSSSMSLGSELETTVNNYTQFASRVERGAVIGNYVLGKILG